MQIWFSMSQNTQHCDRLNKQSWNTAAMRPGSRFSCGENGDRMSTSLAALKENILREPNNNWRPQTRDRLQKTDTCLWHAAVQLPEQCLSREFESSERLTRRLPISDQGARCKFGEELRAECLKWAKSRSAELGAGPSDRLWELARFPQLPRARRIARPLHLAGSKAPIAAQRRSLFSLQSCDAAATRPRLFALDLAEIETCGLC